MLFLIINVVIISKDNSYRGKKKCISRIILKNYRALHRLYERNNIEEFQNEDLKPENRFWWKVGVNKGIMIRYWKKFDIPDLERWQNIA